MLSEQCQALEEGSDKSGSTLAFALAVAIALPGRFPAHVQFIR
jgi:hypothetical protein